MSYDDPRATIGEEQVACPDSEGILSTGSEAGRTTLSHLLRRIVTAWPELRFAHACLIEEGGDHLIVLLDGRTAVRMPREAGRSLAFEAAVLRRICDRIALEVPAYRLSADGRIASYRFIDGVPLTPVRFEALPTATRRRIARQIGTFLSHLHGLVPDEIAPAPSWPRSWSSAEAADYARREILPALARRLPLPSSALQSFLASCEQDEPEQRVVVHGDLVHEHLLMRPGLEALVGIIDFGDVGLGDPVQDLAGLWAYGETLVRDVLAAYRPALRTANVVEHTRRAYLAYLLRRWGTAALEGSVPARKSLTEVFRWIDALQLPDQPPNASPLSRLSSNGVAATPSTPPA